MNTKERNKQKGKLKNKTNLRWIRYAYYMCITMILLFLLYFSLLVSANQNNIVQLFESNLFVSIGFIICTCNLYIWFELKTMEKKLLNFELIDTQKVKLLIILIVQLVLFNYASAILIIMSLVKYFKWNGIKEIIKEIKTFHQGKSIIIMSIILSMFILLTYMIVFKALTL